MPTLLQLILSQNCPIEITSKGSLALQLPAGTGQGDWRKENICGFLPEGLHLAGSALAPVWHASAQV